MDFKENDILKDKLEISNKINYKSNKESKTDDIISEGLFNFFKPKIVNEKYISPENFTVFEHMADDIIKSVNSIKNNPGQLKNPKSLVSLTLMGMPLISMMLLRATGSKSKTSVFLLGLSQAFSTYVNIYRTYQIGSNFNMQQSQTKKISSLKVTSMESFRKTFYIDTSADSLIKIFTNGKFYLPTIVLGLGLGILINKIFQTKFSKRQIKLSDNTYKLSGIYVSGVLTGVILGLLLFIFRIKKDKNNINIKDAIIDYVKFITKGLREVITVGFGNEPLMAISFLLSIAVSFMQIIVYIPLTTILVKDYLKYKDAIEYVGDNKNTDKKVEDKLGKKLERVTKSTFKNTSSLIIKHTNKDFKVDGFLNVIASLFSANKFVKNKSDLLKVYKALKGSEKKDSIISLKSITSLKDDMNKLNKKLSESFINYHKLDDEYIIVESESNSKNPHNSTKIGSILSKEKPSNIFNITDQIKNIEDIHKLDPIPIGNTFESFKRASVKAVVDLYYSLKDNGYKVNDLDICIYREQVPPFSIGSSIHIGRIKALFPPEFSSNHIAAVMAHEAGHVFNQDTISSLSTILPTLVGLLSSCFVFNFKPSGLLPIEKLMFLSSFAISFNVLKQQGKLSEIRADSFAVKLGYDSYLYETLSRLIQKESYIQKLMTEFADEHGDLSRRLKALKEIIGVSDRLSL